MNVSKELREKLELEEQQRRDLEKILLQTTRNLSAFQKDRLAALYVHEGEDWDEAYSHVEEDE